MVGLEVMYPVVALALPLEVAPSVTCLRRATADLKEAFLGRLWERDLECGNSDINESTKNAVANRGDPTALQFVVGFVRE